MSRGPKTTPATKEMRQSTIVCNMVVSCGRLIVKSVASGKADNNYKNLQLFPSIMESYQTEVPLAGKTGEERQKLRGKLATVEDLLSVFTENHDSYTLEKQGEDTGHVEGTGREWSKTYEIVRGHMTVLEVKETLGYVTTSDEFFDYERNPQVSVKLFEDAEEDVKSVFESIKQQLE